MPVASGYAGCGGLGSANGTTDSAKIRHIAPHFRLFARFAPIWRGETGAGSSFSAGGITGNRPRRRAGRGDVFTKQTRQAEASAASLARDFQ